MANLDLGIELAGRNTDILYQPDYWQDRADELRLQAEYLKEEPQFYETLIRQANAYESLARKALKLRQARAHLHRIAPKSDLRIVESNVSTLAHRTGTGN